MLAFEINMHALGYEGREKKEKNVIFLCSLTHKEMMAIFLLLTYYF